MTTEAEMPKLKLPAQERQSLLAELRDAFAV
jgi:hypothetical protein